MRFRSLLSAALVGLAASLPASAALAQAACTRLEAQLAAMQRTNTEAEYRDADARLRQQQADYERSLAAARQLNCMGGGFMFFRAQPAPQCPSLMASIEQLGAGMARLEANRNRLDPRQGQQQRAGVLQALAANNCGPQYQQFARQMAPPQRGGFFGLFGGQTWRDDTYYPAPYMAVPEVQVNTYRTLCVRTCDGYYFPISFSTVQSQFLRDEQVCAAMCPGADVALYMHLNPGQGPEAAVSLTGQRYSALPTAFAYRQSYNSACTCGLRGGGAREANFTPVTRDVVIDRLARLRETVPLPGQRPDPSEDPETLANRRAGFVPDPVAPGTADTVAGLTDDPAMRVIGPAYYYAQ